MGLNEGILNFVLSNGIEVKSISSPELTPAIIYVRGRAKEYDDSIAPREYGNAEGAKKRWLSTLKQSKNITRPY